ncbi:hypothetical protein EON62_01380 [archaeon]|nr:MAG: hypothetical protein EON62_01380 [archaeon]
MMSKSSGGGSSRLASAFNYEPTASLLGRLMSAVYGVMFIMTVRARAHSGPPPLNPPRETCVRVRSTCARCLRASRVATGPRNKNAGLAAGAEGDAFPGKRPPFFTSPIPIVHLY